MWFRWNWFCLDPGRIATLALGMKKDCFEPLVEMLHALLCFTRVKNSQKTFLSDEELVLRAKEFRVGGLSTL